jgi:hypothetical protein
MNEGDTASRDNATRGIKLKMLPVLFVNLLGVFSMPFVALSLTGSP